MPVHRVENLVLLQRFPHEIIAPGCQDSRTVFFKRARREGDNDGITPFFRRLNPSRGLEAVEDWHSHVHPDEVWFPDVPLV